MSEQEHMCCGSLVKVKLMFGSCSLTSGCSSNRPENKESSLKPQLLQGFWFKVKKDTPKIVVMSPTVTAESINSGTCVRLWQSIKSLAENTSSLLGPESRNTW